MASLDNKGSQPVHDNERRYDEYQSRISMHDLLTDAGYVLDRKKSTRRSPVYTKTDSSGERIGERILVNPRYNTCCIPPVMQNYNVISFITNHPDKFNDYKPGMNPYLLVNEVCRRILNEPKNEKSPAYAQYYADSKPFKLDDYKRFSIIGKDFNTVKPFFPYFKTRGIDVATQFAFHHDFFLATQTRNDKQFTNLAFPMRIPGKSDIVGLEMRGMPRMDGSSGYKGKAAGSNSAEGLWIANLGNKPLSQSKNVYWFESAFDAMAYYQLHKDKPDVKYGVFLSSGGNPTYRQFEGVIKEAKNAVHHLCFDNDLAGKQFVENFKDISQKSDEMAAYRSSMRDPKDAYSGDFDLLPKGELSDLYAKREALEERWNDEGRSALVSPDDKEALKNDVQAAIHDFSVKLKESLSFHVDFVREVPDDGYKDWNENLLGELHEKSASEEQSVSTTKKAVGGMDVDGDGVVDGEEKEVKSSSSVAQAQQSQQSHFHHR